MRVLVVLLGLLVAVGLGCDAEVQRASPAQRAPQRKASIQSDRPTLPTEPEGSPATRPHEGLAVKPSAAREPAAVQENSATPPAEPGPSGDLAKMQGSWKVVKFQIGVGNYPTLSALALFKGNTLAFPPIWDQMTIKLNPDAAPKTIDFIPTTGLDKGLVWPGIYEFDGEQLKLCYLQNVDAERPTGFSTKRGEGARVFLLERASP